MPPAASLAPPPGPAAATDPPNGAPGGPAGAPAGAPACPTCGAPRPGRFCPECGERRVDPDDYRLRAFAAHAVDQVFNLDGTLWRTVRALVARPGLLTAEYLAGRRTRYTRPLQLFLLVNVAFFLATGAAGTFRFELAQYTDGRVGGFVLDSARARALVAAKVRREGATPAEVARRFDAASAAQQSVWLLVAPVLGAVVAALYARRRRPYVHHLVFAVHFLAFLLLATGTTISALTLVGRHARPALRVLAGVAPGAADALGGALQYALNGERFAYPLLAWLAVYLVLALRRAYDDPWRWALARALVLAGCIVPLFMLYRDLLFAVTYLSA